MNTEQWIVFSDIFRRHGKKAAKHYLAELNKTKQDIDRICNEYEDMKDELFSTEGVENIDENINLDIDILPF
jgi:hypothetical protein